MPLWKAWPQLGARLRQARQAAGLVQRDLAKAVGVPQSTYSLYERGRQRPSRERLLHLAAVLVLDADELLVLAGYAANATSTRGEAAP